MRKGFTIAEILVVIAVIAVMGAIITEIFSRSLRGGNKSQIISAIKQNGQSMLEVMDKTIRNSDEIVCPEILAADIVAAGSNPISRPSDIVAVVNEDGKYTRFRFIEGDNNANGKIMQDNPVYNPTQSQEAFLNEICLNVDHLSTKPLNITNTDSKNGVSVIPKGEPFTRNKKAGFNDTLSINFSLAPGVLAPVAVAGQVDPVTFTTTIQLR